MKRAPHGQKATHFARALMSVLVPMHVWIPIHGDDCTALVHLRGVKAWAERLEQLSVDSELAKNDCIRIRSGPR